MRLLTRSDFDGLICAVLLKEAGVMDSWKFVHPKDVQDGLVDVTEDDVLANVPYAPGCGLWFDHHSSEFERLGDDVSYEGRVEPEPSCARVIWKYYGGHDTFPERFDTMMHYVDKCDSGMLSQEEFEDPHGWILLSFIMDPRTGLGRYRDYRISNYMLMMQLVDWCRKLSVEDILEMPDVRERVVRYYEQEKFFKAMIRECAERIDNVVCVDLRDQEEIFTGNRFTVYALYPEANVSIQIMWGKQQQNVVFTAGHSIIDRSCSADIGRLMLAYGGGGHRKVGTCQVAQDRADEVKAELIAALRGT